MSNKKPPFKLDANDFMKIRICILLLIAIWLIWTFRNIYSDTPVEAVATQSEQRQEK